MQKARTLPVVFAIILVDMLGVGILIPVIPLLLTDPAYPYHLGLSMRSGLITLGLLMATFPLLQFFATPILGQLSDRVGRKPVLIISIIGTSLSYVVFAIGIITKNVPLLFASRALDGITGGNIAVAQAAIADSTTPENRAKSFGIIGAAFGIGFIVGPFLGGKLSDPQLVSWFSATTPFWFAAILAALNVLAVLFYFKETLVHVRDESMHPLQALINIKKAVLNPRLRALFTSSFLFQSGFTFFTTFLGVYLISKFSFNQGDIGNYFALVGICIVFTQGIVTGFVAKRFTPRAILITTLLGVSTTIYLLHVVQTVTAFYLVTIPNAMCIGLIMANITALISREASPREQGEVLGIGTSVQALAGAIPPAIAGFAAASISPAAPLIAASCIISISALVFILFVHPHEETV